MNKTIKLIGLLAITSAVVASRPAPIQAQAAGNLTLGIYAPSVAFADATARANYITGLAKAVSAKTGMNVTGKAYAKLSDLKAAKPDFAIVEGLCVATGVGTPLATAIIGGGTTQSWALFSKGDGFGQLKGKKLAYLDTSCRDIDFMDNALLDSEAKVKAHFGSLIGRQDTASAVDAVKSFGAADAVFAPASSGKGLNRVFDAGAVPNPAFVQMNKTLPAGVVSNAKAAVITYGAQQGIEGWKDAVSYAGLGGQLAFRAKKPVFATPEVVRLDDQDILVIPQSKYETTKVKQHFFEPTVKP